VPGPAADNFIAEIDHGIKKMTGESKVKRQSQAGYCCRSTRGRGGLATALFVTALLSLSAAAAIASEERHEVLDADKRLEVSDAEQRREVLDAEPRREDSDAEQRREVEDAEQRNSR
jgi:hypothetical protein